MNLLRVIRAIARASYRIMRRWWLRYRIKALRANMCTAGDGCDHCNELEIQIWHLEMELKYGDDY